MTFSSVLVAGASGAIGSEIVRELQSRGSRVRALVRDPSRLTTEPEEIFVGNLQNPRTLEGACEGVDAVVSSAGAPLRSKRWFTGGRETFYDIDDAGNRNLLEKAAAANVRRFAYVAAYGGRFVGMMEYIRAHESFAAALRASGLDGLVVRPTTTFARLAPLMERARKKRKLSVVGAGQARTNPVHEADVAKALVDELDGRSTDLDIGGPDVLTQGEIAELAAEAAGNAKVVLTLTWRAQLQAVFRRFTGRHNYDVMVYQLAQTEVDVVAPAVGERRLRDYFAGLAV